MSLYYEDEYVNLYHGDALDVARTLPDGLARCIVTSPPYFGLRDYGEPGQYGAEASVGEYVSRMVELFREMRRVLADDGTLWLNLGDSYNTYAAGRGPAKGLNKTRHEALQVIPDGYGLTEKTLGNKQLMGVPWRVAFALQEDGWILRSDIIWHKPNPMPESVTDRPTKAHEYVFLFAKNPRYYYDADAIKEPAVTGYNGSDFTTGKQNGGRTYSGNEYAPNGLANKRTVWTVPTVPFPGAHFAVYPPDLIRPCIRAGSAVGDTILDPFSGSGTTGAVATHEGRRYIGIDLNRDYLDLSLRTRFQQPVLPWGGDAA